MSLARFSTASRDHGVDQADDRRFAGHVAQMLQVLFVRSDGFAFGFTARAIGEVFVDAVNNFLLARQHRLHFQASDGFKRLNGFHIQWIGHCDAQRRVRHADWQRAKLAQKSRGQAFRFRNHQRRSVDGHQWNLQLVTQFDEQIFRTEKAEVEKNLPDLFATLFLDFESPVQLFLRDELPRDEPFTDSHLVCCLF